MPREWHEALLQWRSTNQRHKRTVDGFSAPGANDEYLFYQSLLGAWLPEAEIADGLKRLRDRMKAYMRKAVRESQARSSWSNPNRRYEEAVSRFVELLLADHSDNPFLEQFKPFQRRVDFFGKFNSLSQTLLKITAPGVPDFYQGTELWDFNLVDPDNRRPVDYDLRRSLLAGLRGRFDKNGTDTCRVLVELMQESDPGQLKLFLIWRALHFRRQHLGIFERGRYVPLSASGVKQNHVCAFSRSVKDQAVVVVVPRLIVGLTNGLERLPLGLEVWQNTLLRLPSSKAGDRYHNVFTQERYVLPEPQDGLPLADLLSHFPVALLERGA
jgi:(1->4)-alpha-D-glucan 1-alpha-D-glucosylmutase